jgi:hypothetical protein
MDMRKNQQNSLGFVVTTCCIDRRLAMNIPVPAYNPRRELLRVSSEKINTMPAPQIRPPPPSGPPAYVPSIPRIDPKTIDGRATTPAQPISTSQSLGPTRLSTPAKPSSPAPPPAPVFSPQFSSYADIDAYLASPNQVFSHCSCIVHVRQAVTLHVISVCSTLLFISECRQR